MKRLVVAVLTCTMLFGVFCSQLDARADQEGAEPVNVGNTVCPVMGTKIAPGEALTVEYMGRIYNVCCAHCVGEFQRSPEKYVTIVEEQMREGVGN